jgi:eukaryotic-like serine/threonine-protein kinase
MPRTLDHPAPDASATADALQLLCFSDPVFAERYRGWSVLGRGSNATVVRTFGRDAGREIALKVFVNLEPHMVQRVREEVQAVQTLATPHVVQVYSLFDRGPIAWFEMELVEGRDLDQELQRLAAAQRQLPLRPAFAIALAVGRCLWHAHRAGVLHRDVKPANIILPASGQPAAKLTDFGIARLANRPASTPAGTVLGTPRFASPEALAGRFAGRAHDVFGYCTTLYALFSGGAMPFEADPEASLSFVRMMKLESTPAPLTTRRPDIGESVSNIIARGLSPHIMLRPSIRRIVTTLEAEERRGTRRVGVPPNSRRSPLQRMANARRAMWAKICEWGTQRGRRMKRRNRPPR